jgi:hypothetical protein
MGPATAPMAVPGRAAVECDPAVARTSRSTRPAPFWIAITPVGVSGPPAHGDPQLRRDGATAATRPPGQPERYARLPPRRDLNARHQLPGDDELDRRGAHLVSIAREARPPNGGLPVGEVRSLTAEFAVAQKQRERGGSERRPSGSRATRSCDCRSVVRRDSTGNPGRGSKRVGSRSASPHGRVLWRNYRRAATKPRASEHLLGHSGTRLSPGRCRR